MRSFTQGHIKTGIASVRSAKLRSFWTMLGVIIGVASVISVVAIGEGIKQQIGGQIHRFGDNLITVRPAQLHTTGDSGSKGLNLLAGLNITSPITPKDLTAIKRVENVTASAPISVATGSVQAPNGKYTQGFVLGTTGDLPSLINQSMAFGSFFSDDDSGMNVAVLGQTAVDDMFDEDVPLGRSFEYHGERFIVRGIFNQFTSTPLSQQADFNKAIFIPHEVAQRLTNNTGPTYAVLARPAKPEQADQVARDISRALDKTHGGESGFDVLTGNQNIATSNAILDLLTRMIGGIAAISLLVGGIGIMNVMLVSVAERMHEIGIRKAVGATNRQILGQFLVESSLLTFTGGVIGIALAYLLQVILRLTTSLKPVITWEVVVVATGISLLIGVIFGTVPAIKAARKHPIDALRSE